MKISLGKFLTNGQLVATDPCYKLKNKLGKALKVLPGTYQVSVTVGKLKDAFMMWDRIPGNLRVSRIMIKHADHRGALKFKKVADLGVDGGQAGFFNLATYRKNLTKPRQLPYDNDAFLRDSIRTSRGDIFRGQQALKMKPNDPEWEKSRKIFKTIKAFKRYHEERMSMARENIKDTQKILQTKKYPAYLEPKFSKEWYDIICDLRYQHETYGGVSEFGAIAGAGLGDGYYPLYVARNAQGKIVASYIEFLSPREIK